MMWPISSMSLPQLARLYALRRGYEPLRADCEISREDGVDLDQLMRHEAHGWYVRQLSTLPISDLPVRNVASGCALKMCAGGEGEIVLPSGVVRVAGVRLRSWCHGVEPVASSTPEAEAQANPWCRGGRYAPVAVLRDGYVSVYVPSGANDAVAELNVVMMPDEDGTYLLTPPMLANMSME